MIREDHYQRLRTRHRNIGVVLLNQKKPASARALPGQLPLIKAAMESRPGLEVEKNERVLYSNRSTALSETGADSRGDPFAGISIPVRVMDACHP